MAEAVRVGARPQRRPRQESPEEEREGRTHRRQARRDRHQVDLDRGPDDDVGNVPRQIDTGRVKVDGSNDDANCSNADTDQTDVRKLIASNTRMAENSQDTKHEHDDDSNTLQLWQVQLSDLNDGESEDGNVETHVGQDTAEEELLVVDGAIRARDIQPKCLDGAAVEDTEERLLTAAVSIWLSQVP